MKHINIERMLLKILLIPFSILIAILILLSSSNAFSETYIDMDKIMMIESSGDEGAYNKSSGAIGLYQITKICLKEYNNFHTKQQYSSEDLYSPLINEQIARWYMNERIPSMLNYYNIPDTVSNRLWAYNAGIGKVIDKDMPFETRKYLSKYHKLSR